MPAKAGIQGRGLGVPLRGNEQKYLETLPEKLKLPRPVNRLKLQTGASRVARSVCVYRSRSARKHRGGADAIAKSFACFDRRRDCGRVLDYSHARSSANLADRL